MFTKCFLSLIDKNFPKSNPLHKIFNRNTLKLSYSCMGNIKTIISNHNKAEINKATRTNDQKKNCNCRKPNLCPMDGNCNAENVIYQAEVTTSTTKEIYIGLCDTTFKLRCRNHICSFRNERYKHATELSNFLLVMTAIVYCSVFSNIFDCNRYFWQSPDDCFA